MPGYPAGPHGPHPDLVGRSTATELRQADGIDRIKELLNSHIDHYSNALNLIENAITRIVGSTPMPVPPDAPRPPISERSIYNLLSDIESLDRRMSEQLARIREQLP